MECVNGAGYNGSMNRNLFDEKQRDWTKPSLRAETTYSFYDRSALDEFARQRRMLQRWIDHLPPSKQGEFVRRMRHTGRGSANKEQNFQGAFFELFLHEFFSGTGGEVETEPLIHGRTPDFGVTEAISEGTINYLVEATNVHLGGDFASSWNERCALDALDEIVSPDFSLWVETKGDLTLTPKKRGLKRPFEELIKTADYDDVRERWERSTSAGHIRTTPSATVQCGDWTLTGWLMPVGNRPNKGRFIGIGPGKGGVLDDIGRTKSELYGKADSYKRLDNLIIALRGYGWPLDRVDEALFGRSVLNFYVPNDPAYAGPVPSPRERQILDGFWFNSGGPINEHIIGVLIFDGLYPQSVDRATAVFYANPYTEKPMPAWTKAITHVEYDAGKVHFVEGVPPCTFVPDHEPITNVQWKH